MPNELVVREEPDEARELVRLGLEELAGAVSGLQAFHTAIADRAFAYTPGGKPIRYVHDRISGAVYGGMRAVPRGAATLADRARAERATGYVRGGISPLGQRRRLPTVLDASAVSFDRIYVSAGRRGLQVALAPTDLRRLTDALLAPIARLDS